MKRLVTALLPLLLHWPLMAEDNEEFRATWVVTWDLIDPDNSTEENQALARSIMDNHLKANMNAVLWQARQSGTAYYPSSFEPWGTYAGYEDPGYDPLAFAVDEAHRRGLELHAWMNVFEARSTVEGAPAEAHPDWICRDRDGNPMTSNFALSPGLEVVREYLVQVAMEIVRNYDIDGLHLDYIRWNEFTSSGQSVRYGRLVAQNRYPDGMITEEQIRELQQNPEGRYLYDIEHPYSAGIPDSVSGGQFPSWEDWWRWTVTEFVRTLHDSIQAEKPWVRLSVAALGKYNWSGWQGYNVVFQDAALWFNQGYIDQLTPMHYHWTTGDEFTGMLRGSCPECWEEWIEEGIEDGRLYTVGPGSYALADRNRWNNHPEIVESSRAVPWVDGFQFFRYGTWDYYRYWDEAKTVFFPNKTKVRGSGLVDTTRPNPPSIELERIDSLTYRLTVAPQDAGGTESWYALYRSEDDHVDPGKDPMVERVFGNSAFTVQDTFSGTQDFNGRYRYGATALDRYWNESQVSEVVMTDSVPSFPPVVIHSVPGEGDTVSVNTQIIISFSKTMDISTVPGALSVTPAVGIEQAVWSTDYRTLTVQFDTLLDYATSYTFTVGASAQDVNGSAMDGNGDGVGGDPHELHFVTEEEDVSGPRIASSYPDYEGTTGAFDVDDVMTIVFDEEVDPASITDSTVVVSTSNTAIDKSYLLTLDHNRTVLSVQSDEPLSPDRSYEILLDSTVSDVLGNAMGLQRTVPFRTLNLDYVLREMIDEFTFAIGWQDPGYSGSTVGTLAGTRFGWVTDNYLPASKPKKSARLKYAWDTSASEHLLREYLKDGSAREVLFDTSYVLQVYLYGDGSYNKFRFCVDDHAPTEYVASYHEVSEWVTIDWVGWRLVEWDLASDPVGTWIGNGILEGSLRIDSFQLTYVPGAAATGTLYFDDLRIVRKTPPLSVAFGGPTVPREFRLLQNYPNPFNSRTVIPFELPVRNRVKVVVYDIRGRQVAALLDRELPAGVHAVTWDGETETGGQASSGLYIYRVSRGEGVSRARTMVLIK
ncbi:MAG: family 10 glycosylhydrolase [Fidelibacterota bacterium]